MTTTSEEPRIERTSGRSADALRIAMAATCACIHSNNGTAGFQPVYLSCHPSPKALGERCRHRREASRPLSSEMAGCCWRCRLDATGHLTTRCHSLRHRLRSWSRHGHLSTGIDEGGQGEERTNRWNGSGAITCGSACCRSCHEAEHRADRNFWHRRWSTWARASRSCGHSARSRWRSG